MSNILNARRNLLERRQQTDISLATQPNADMATITHLRYDYDQLPSEHREFVRSVAVNVAQKAERQRREKIAVGKMLVEVRERIGDGLFGEWIETEFDMSRTSAYQFIAIYTRFGDIPDAPKLLTDSVMGTLSSPSVPNTAINAVIEEAKTTGRSPSIARAKEIIERSKPGRKAKPVTIDGKATRVEKQASGPGAGGHQAFTETETAEYVEAQLLTALRVLPIYAAKTGDAASAAELRQIVAKMLGNLR